MTRSLGHHELWPSVGPVLNRQTAAHNEATRKGAQQLDYQSLHDDLTKIMALISQVILLISSLSEFISNVTV